MIRILPIASGSTGNCLFAELDGRRILVDLGLPARSLLAALKGSGIAPESIEAVFITHSHSDHTKGLRPCANKLLCPLFMSDGTRSTLYCEDAAVLPYDRPTEPIPGLRVTAFRTSHDCAGSVGYLFETEQSRLGYATDLGVMTGEIRSLLAGCEVLVLESNHDIAMLRTGPYPAQLKRRILSDAGHLSNDACAEAMRFFITQGTRHFLLAHLSRENNTPALALASAQAAIGSAPVTVEALPVGPGELKLFE